MLQKMIILCSMGYLLITTCMAAGGTDPKAALKLKECKAGTVFSVTTHTCVVNRRGPNVRLD